MENQLPASQVREQLSDVLTKTLLAKDF